MNFIKVLLFIFANFNIYAAEMPKMPEVLMLDLFNELHPDKIKELEKYERFKDLWDSVRRNSPYSFQTVNGQYKFFHECMDEKCILEIFKFNNFDYLIENDSNIINKYNDHILNLERSEDNRIALIDELFYSQLYEELKNKIYKKNSKMGMQNFFKNENNILKKIGDITYRKIKQKLEPSAVTYLFSSNIWEKVEGFVYNELSRNAGLFQQLSLDSSKTIICDKEISHELIGFFNKEIDFYVNSKFDLYQMYYNNESIPVAVKYIVTTTYFNSLILRTRPEFQTKLENQNIDCYNRDL